MSEISKRSQAHAAEPGRARHPMTFAARLAAALAVAMLATGCTRLGPDFVKPEADVQNDWLLAERPEIVASAGVDDARWWQVFEDPVLNQLVETAHQQNLTLQTAGIRILEARAQLGVAVGGLYPQVQQATGDIAYATASENTANTGVGDLNFWTADIGMTTAWELDLWGRFARGIESADAAVLASVANYDDLLVSLTAQVATAYILVRTFEERIRTAKENVAIQQRGFELSEVRFRNGATTELDVLQAETILRSTQASVAGFEAGRRQSVNALGTLLGITPAAVTEIVYGGATPSQGIPTAPKEVAVGIPADLLRRRPDVRLAEMQAWSQSALIGVAQADLYPSISLVGTIGLSASDGTRTSRNGEVDFGDIFDGDALRFAGGPSVTWNIFNYGRIKNNVRVQDARLQQLLVNYQNTVLRAGQEVEDSMVDFLQAKVQSEFLEQGVTAARRSVDLALIQYADGATSYTTVLNTQQALVAQQDALIATYGEISRSLVTIYRALGGGWEIRRTMDVVPESIRNQMRDRTDWGGLLGPGIYDENQPPDEAARPFRRPDW